MTSARLLLGLAVLTTLLVVQFGLYRVLERFADDPLADGRIPFARNTIEAALAFFPVGSGLGTFTVVYPTFEKTNDLMANTFANHAHNDLLELWLEAGVPGAVVAALCAIWILQQTLRVWRAASWGTRSVDLLLARAASIAHRSCRRPLAVRLPPAHRRHDDSGSILLCSIDPARGTYSFSTVKPQSSDAGRCEPAMRRARQRPSHGSGLGLYGAHRSAGSGGARGSSGQTPGANRGCVQVQILEVAAVTTRTQTTNGSPACGARRRGRV